MNFQNIIGKVICCQINNKRYDLWITVKNNSRTQECWALAKTALEYAKHLSPKHSEHSYRMYSNTKRFLNTYNYNAVYSTFDSCLGLNFISLEDIKSSARISCGINEFGNTVEPAQLVWHRYYKNIEINNVIEYGEKFSHRIFRTFNFTKANSRFERNYETWHENHVDSMQRQVQLIRQQSFWPVIC